MPIYSNTFLPYIVISDFQLDPLHDKYQIHLKKNTQQVAQEPKSLLYFSSGSVSTIFTRENDYFPPKF